MIIFSSNSPSHHMPSIIGFLDPKRHGRSSARKFIQQIQIPSIQQQKSSKKDIHKGNKLIIVHRYFLLFSSK
ncbi:unnamed protein product [Musa banksii]